MQGSIHPAATTRLRRFALARNSAKRASYLHSLLLATGIRTIRVSDRGAEIDQAISR
jgi:hypothetical protein